MWFLDLSLPVLNNSRISLEVDIMKVLVADPLSKEGIEIMKTVAEVDVKTGLKEAELVQIIGNYEGLVVRSQTTVTPAIIEAGKKLIIIGRAG